MIPQTTPTEAAKTLGEHRGAVYLDVRTPEEFAAGHPKGAWNAPVVFFDAARNQQPNPDFERVVRVALPKETKIVVGCQSGVRSERAAEILAALGYRDVTNVRGGFGGQRGPGGEVVVAGWRDSGLPVETGTPPGTGWDDLKKKA